jgi:hypothetical protein
MFLDIIHGPVYIPEHNVSEARFFLRLQVKPFKLDPVETASPYLSLPKLPQAPPTSF